MDNKNKFLIFFVAIILIASVYFITSITFTTGTYVEMFPAFSGTVCVLEDENCVDGTEKSIDFALANVWANEEFALTDRTNFPIPIIILDNVRYRGTGGPLFYGASVENERDLMIQVMEKIHQNNNNIRFGREGGYASEDLPEGFRLSGMNTLNDDGSEIINTMQIVFVEEGSIYTVDTSQTGNITELSLNLNGQIYTLISIEKEVTEPITYTFEG
ncbi:hypothetical protein HY448_00015 [Candidatus Pacearchaeota archaeon]|nr:hypothetical protein [Candidatus Pacearchaeota archaeon]MBI5803061.1 hypothetical protein [Candidatus Pacearchaeota archaeon]